ncbi:amino acid ABC transporter permease [Rhizobium sp. RU36D]|uniref:amino acid ABC transporter permease n=1 Tax=Rhizobium sp. RU36D TaxID=1907415 RepID=UPI0009D829DC|nr:amino acid ABC transporter permease [Rhizobium sp. RU36D]SMD11840.1 amino acid ABC transporter membrane protein 2, PAAT family [Rhizobium sp. RU36D]
MLDRIIEEAPRFFTYFNMIFILKAMGTTLLLTALGCVTGFVFGFLIAATRATRSKVLLPLRLLLIAYVEIFRRIPFLVILFIVMFAIQMLIGNISLFTIAVISICILSTAFLSEVIRAGMESVPRQQIEAAETLNFGFWRTQFRVILPQSWKVILPPAFAFMVMFIKDTSLASQMGVIELTFTGKSLMNRGFSPFLVYGVVLAGYFAMSYPLSLLGTYMEKRLATARN